MSDIERALSTSVASTGAYLLPEVVDPVIRDYVAKATPVLSVVTRVNWPTQTYYIRKRSGLPTAAFSTDGGSLPSASSSTYAKVAKTVKYLYTRGEVTGPLVAAAGGVVNALQEEIRVHSGVIAERLATAICVGDGTEDTNAGIIGIKHQINTSTPGDEGGTTDASAAALTLAMLDKALDDTKGEADVIMTSRAVRRKISALLQGQQRFLDRVEVGAGFRVLSYDGVPIVTDDHYEEDEILVFRRADAKLIVNQDFTMEMLAKTKDAEDFYIKGYFGFALEGRPVRLSNFTI